MRQIWTHDTASYHGDHVHFDHITSWPKPVRKPAPPILVAGKRAHRGLARHRLRRRVDPHVAPRRPEQHRSVQARRPQARQRSADPGHAVRRRCARRG
ncbi:hypothetical protein LDL49_55130 [Nonomuraea sp. NEAU-L178]|nr:hypothetical protein [Nonomuraea aurantiaca]